jgi:hypothetical protein
VATTAYLTYVIGEPLLGNSATALFASALYLLNFAVSNGQLAALVDSGEALFLMALVVSMGRKNRASRRDACQELPPSRSAQELIPQPAPETAASCSPQSNAPFHRTAPDAASP